jgi:hypothetical protein
MKKLLSLVLLMGLSFSLTSCKEDSKVKKIFKDVDIQTTGEEEVFVSSTVSLDLGNVELPFAQFDLPKNYGSVAIAAYDGLSHVTVNVNLSSIAGLPGGIGELPNGSSIPVEMTAGGVVQIDIPKINGRVYVAYTSEVALLGFAFSIEQLDFLGDLEKVGVWFPLNIKNVKLMGGVYFDDVAENNGIGIFVDLKGIIPWKANLAGLNVYPQNYVEFKAPKVKRRVKRKVYRKLRRLMKGKKQTLNLVIE